MSTTLYAEPVAVHPPISEPMKNGAAGPTVSVVIPCYNEENFIGKALTNLADQYSPEQYEIVVVDGMSTDRTRLVIEEFRVAHAELSIRVLDNPMRNIPNALNIGIAAATGEIIARMDAHAVPSAGYVRRCVSVLEQTDVAVVGMPCRVRPADITTVARAIAIGVSHPFGIGDAKYRLTTGAKTQEDVDTVAFACFRKSLWSSLDGFNENLLTNEDYDFNYRARANGQRVVLDRMAHCDYFARPTLAGLASQYLRYGMWKARMLRSRPESVKLRQLVAPTFVVSIVTLVAAGFFHHAAWWFLTMELLAYFAAAFAFGLQATRRNGEKFSVMLTMPLVFCTIHFSWGSSFLWGLATSAGKRG